MSLPMTRVVEDTSNALLENSENLQALRDEIETLQEANRIILDVFWSAFGIVKTCCAEGNCDRSCEVLLNLLKSLEANVKETPV